MKKNGDGSKGFSLVELMIVVIIISILAAVAIPAYLTYIFKTRLISKLDFSEEQAMAMVENETFIGAIGTRITSVRHMMDAGYTQDEIAALAIKGSLEQLDPTGVVYATMLAEKKQETAAFNPPLISVSESEDTTPQTSTMVVKGKYTYETVCTDGYEFLIAYRVVSTEEHVGGMFENLTPIGITQKFNKDWEGVIGPVACYEE